MRKCDLILIIKLAFHSDLKWSWNLLLPYLLFGPLNYKSYKFKKFM